MIKLGDSLQILKSLASNSIDSLVTDPPAGISFMGKDWDKSTDFIASMSEIYSECLRVLKPGAHGLVWAIPRTSHWTATALEQSGFEIRDVIVHIFGSGFPKSLDVSKALDKMHGAEREVIGFDQSKARPNKERFAKSVGENTGHGIPGIKDNGATLTCPATPEAKQWSGFGTALKPANEHWILVRKPLGEATVAKNVLKHGTGALNIDASRIEGHNPSIDRRATARKTGHSPTTPGLVDDRWRNRTSPEVYAEYRQSEHLGRFPANLIVDESAVEELDEQSGVLKSGSGQKSNGLERSKSYSGGFKPDHKEFEASQGGASRFFYCAKASKKDRGEGNTHPTVKSTKLMEYLIRLITPPNGTVLDPFMGSGSTGVAAHSLSFNFIGIEKEKEYFDIATNRLGGAA